MNFENILWIALIFYMGWHLYELLYMSRKPSEKLKLISRKTGQVIELNLVNEKGESILQQMNADDAFIVIAKNMFARIVHAFTTGNLESIQGLVTEKVSSVFKNAIDMRRAQKQHMDFTLVDFKEVKLLKTDSPQKREVAFTTEQINLLKDQEGKVISGDPLYVTTVKEIWTFERQSDNSWVLCATKQGVQDVA